MREELSCLAIKPLIRNVTIATRSVAPKQTCIFVLLTPDGVLV